MRRWQALPRRVFNWGWALFAFGVHSTLQLRERRKVDRARRGLGDKQVATLRPLQPGRFAIFATYPRFPLEPTLLNMLKQLTERGVQLLVVATTPLGPEDRDSIARFASAIIDIGNVGRDFGAYQQGVFHLRDTVGLDAVERLVFLNDTLFFLSGRDPLPMIDALLDEQHPYVGANENFDRIYHVGSFCLAFGRRAVSDPCFLRFWEAYMPFSNRVHAIRHGEQGLTECMMQAGIVPHVLYSWHQVADEVLAYVTAPDRPAYMFCLEVREMLLAKPERSPEALATAVAQYYQDHNQVHALGLFFVRYLGMPFLKRDIVWNRIHLLSDVTSFVAGDQVEDVERVVKMLRQKGMPTERRRLMVRLKSRLQLI